MNENKAKSIAPFIVMYDSGIDEGEEYGSRIRLIQNLVQGTQGCGGVSQE